MKRNPACPDPANLVIDILTGAANEDEQLRTFHRALNATLHLPLDGFVIGDPVSVVKISYHGNPKRGLTATCRKADGREHDVALADVGIPEGSPGNQYWSAYRNWLGLSVPSAPECESTTSPNRSEGVVDDLSLDLKHPIDLVVMSVKHPTLRVRPVGSRQEITLRTRSAWQQVPGEIIAVQGKKFWRYAGHPYLSGEILSQRRDVTALELTPLKLQECGVWDPAEEYWGDKGDPSPDWAQDIIANGRRPSYEMEQIIPGNDPEDPEDAITRSADLKEAGALDEAEALLMPLLQADLRCLDAHVHLGNLDFDRRPDKAARHYRMTQDIGELSLGPGFRDVLLWGHINNRPYLRALHGLALCLWRLDQRPEAIAILKRILWLNPPDNQGVRFLLPDIQAGISWEATGDNLDNHGNQATNPVRSAS